MSEIKTLTINGKTYTVSDADSVSFEEEQDLSADQQARARDNIGAACIDDAKVGADAWSSQKTSEEMDRSISVAGLETIDKLCPSFTESGSVAVCEPVEGYPLGVTSRIEPVQEGSGDPYPPGGGKNFARADSTRTVDVDAGIVVKTTVNTAEIVVNGTATANHSMSLFYNIALPAGTYTASVWGLVDADYLNCETADGGYPVQGLHSGTPKTFTISEEITIKIAAVFVSGSVYSNATVKIQIEAGSTATEYAPYSNIRPISGHSAVKLTRCGKNLIDPVKMNEACDSRTTLDGDVFTTKFESGGIHINIGMGYRKYYPKGTYTFTFIPLTDGAHASLFVYAKSNGATIVRNRELNATNGFSYTFTANEEFAPCLAGYLLDGVYGTYSYKLQLEAGSTATEYEPYQGNTFTLDLGQTVYVGSLDWATGVLTVTHSSVVFDGVSVGKKMDGADPQSARLDYTYTTNLNGRLQKLNGKAYSDRAYGYIINNTKAFLLSLPKNITGVTNEDDESTTIEKFNAVLGSWYNAGTPLMAVFEMETPITIQLTAQEILALSGVNTLYSDTGDAEVTGKADPRAIINDQNKLIESILGRVAALEAAAVNNT